VVDEARYGESVVREVLGATFLSEEKDAAAADDTAADDTQLSDPEG
jgi:hypothetical protein